MADQVIAVDRITNPNNPAAIEKAINDLIASLFSDPVWVRQGPNWIRNSETGEARNLYQEALAVLEKQGPRSDAVATVKNADGETSRIWIDQETVHSVGGDLGRLKSDLQRVISEDSGGSGKLMLFAALGIGAYFIFRKK